MSETRIVFIGGLTNGKVVLDYLNSNKHVTVALVITHPVGSRVPRYVDISKDLDEAEIIFDLNANNHIDATRSAKPDYIFVAGWSGLLSRELIDIAVKGTIGFHPSRLPYDRGRSVLAWQIEEGYTETALTMFFYNELPDCGDIIAQEKIAIEQNDYISDILDKLDRATFNIIKAYFQLIRKGVFPRRKQDLNEGSFRRLRTDLDSQIEWDRNARVIYNKIRAISRPYPGAFFMDNGKKRRVWRSEIVSVEDIDVFSKTKPGDFLSDPDGNEYIVRCRDGAIKISADSKTLAE